VQIYGRSFYQARHANTRYAAEHILSLVLERLPPVSSAVDVGCGVGTWVPCLISRGVSDVQGIEGRVSVLVPAHNAAPTVATAVRSMLTQSWTNLEIVVIDDGSTDATADIVIFSAAVPFQGGKHHVNEQWPEYWVQLFARQTYRCFDWIRPLIWNDQEIPVWYRQNILIFVAERRISDLRPMVSMPPMPLAVIHPEIYTMKLAPRPFGQRMSSFAKRMLGR